MEGNKDEAIRCIEIAKTSINTSNYEKADKFLRKAQNLYPTETAEKLLDHIAKMTAGNSNSNTSNANTNTSSDENIRQRRSDKNTTSSANTQQQQQQQSEAKFTKEQSELVEKVKKCKDFYEVLGVTKEATDSDIKKAYKKLALQLHPDKNHAPGAVEAFKTVGNAVATLTDVRKRKDYDTYGHQITGGNGGRGHFNHSTGFQRGHHATFEYGGYESEISAEELFNMFFGGFPPQARRQRYTQQQHHETGPQPSLAFGLILVLIFISMLSSFFTSDPLYSLTQTSKYSVQRQTSHLGVPYYVRDNFAEEYQGSLGRLENSVEEDYIHAMKQNCYRERNYRENMIARARSFGSRSQVAQAQASKTPSCDNLAKIGLTRYSLY